MSKFQDYLRELGALNSSQEEKDKLFKMYRKEYMRAHHLNRRKHQKLVQIWFEQPEYTIILDEAKKLNLKVTDFIRQVLKAQRQQSYVLPDEKVLYDLIISFSRIGNLINQVAYLCNKKKQVGHQELQRMQELFTELRSTTIAHYRPLHVEDYIRGEMKKSPRFLSHLQRIIDDFKHLGYASH